VAPGGEESFAELCQRQAVPATVLGQTGGDSLAVTGQFAVPLAELAGIHQRVLPALFG